MDWNRINDLFSCFLDIYQLAYIWSIMLLKRIKFDLNERSISSTESIEMNIKLYPIIKSRKWTFLVE